MLPYYSKGNDYYGRKEAFPTENPPQQNKSTRFWDLFKEFCDRTTLHGLRYVGEAGRVRLERIFWTIAVIASLSIAMSIIYDLFVKMDDSPVLVSLGQSFTPIWDIPFPAVTICSENKILRQFTENQTDAKSMSYTSLICDRYRTNKSDKYTDAQFYKYIAKSTQDCNDMIWRCTWQGVLTKCCNELFYPTVTEDGLCYSFNMMDHEELFTKEVIHDLENNVDTSKYDSGWTLENGYPASARMNTYPRRSMGAGYPAGLSVFLDLRGEDMDQKCSGASYGFKVMLHSPSEFPLVKRSFTRIPLDSQVVLVVSPQVTITSNRLYKVSSKKRMCLFNKERKLRFFKYYTQQNCQKECLTNHTLNLCGCVAFHMPRNRSMKICGPQMKECTKEAEVEMFQNEMMNELQSGTMMGDGKGQDCSCLPACTEINYDVRFSFNDQDWEQIFTTYGRDDYVETNYGHLEVFFRDQQYLANYRGEMYGPMDFLANVGGILGLFLGFSMLSGVELIYFFSLRVFCDYWKRLRNEQKSKSSVLPYVP